jgi:DNA-binding transcriptional LysR family regulator
MLVPEEISGLSPDAARLVQRLKLRQLQLVIAVGEQGSILNAARGLNMAQPSATKLIKDLEAAFGVPLFERTNRGVVPTMFGEALIRHGKLILSQVTHAAEEIADLADGSGGRVVVGTLLAAAPLLLPRTVARVLAARPNLQIKVVEATNERLMPALRVGELDFAVGRLPAHRFRDELAQERLYDERVVAVTRPDHPLQGRACTLGEVAGGGFILPPPETTLRRQIDQMFFDAGLEQPRRVVESISYLANRSLLAGTDLIGFLPEHVTRQDAAAGLIAPLDWEVPIPRSGVGVSYRRGRGLSPAAAYVLDELRREAARLSRSAPSSARATS